MQFRATWMSTLLIAGVAGCLGRGQNDLLQARLREQNQRLADVQTQLDAASRELRLAHRESEGLRQQLANSSSGNLLPEQADLLVRVSDLRINSMLTAGVDRDEVAGDDALVVQFAPIDDDGELVRLPGEIHITAIDPKAPESSRTVAEWTIAAEDSREHWMRGFLGAGYQLTLPWPAAPPRNRELVITVTLRPADGREFTATHIVKVTPPVMTAEGTSSTTTKTLRVASPQDQFVPKPVDEEPVRRPAVIDSTNWMDGVSPVRR